MTDPIKPEKSPDGPGNHPRTSTHGGASAFPTPANNAGGGRGWGDKGFWKGGTDGGQQGAGHENVFFPLTQQSPTNPVVIYCFGQLGY